VLEETLEGWRHAELIPLPLALCLRIKHEPLVPKQLWKELPAGPNLPNAQASPVAKKLQRVTPN